jgi:HlyD family type I secretion membrane fusion protein
VNQTRAAPALMIETNRAEALDGGGPEIRLGLLLIILFFVGFGGWAALAPLDAAVTAPGAVVVSGNRQTVQHREGGIVSAIIVREGDRVQESQVLVELASSELRAQERALIGQAIELEATRARLIAEQEGVDSIATPEAWAGLASDYREVADGVLARQLRELQARSGAVDAQLDVLGQRREQLSARIAGYEDQILSLDRQDVLIGDELAGVRQLADRGLAPLTRVRALERAQAELQGRRAELRALIEQSRQAIGESAMQGIAVGESRAETLARELRETETRLAEILPQVDAVRAQLERTLIRAPATGQVVGLQVHTVGGVVRPGEPLMDIVPEAQPLVLEAQVSPAHADDLQIGMRTEVRFISFTGVSMPLVFGEVTRVSADRFVDERSGAAYFIAEITVSAEQIAVVDALAPQGSGVRAGLPVDVVVPLRERTALQYLVEPLNRQLWMALREN